MSEQNHFLKKLELAGFRSIQETCVEFSSGLNVFIGANGAGKSNIISFFRMLGQMMDTNRGLRNYVAENGFADGLLFRGWENTRVLSASLSLNSCLYEFSLATVPDNTLFFTSEQICVDGNTSFQGRGHMESLLASFEGYNVTQEIRDSIRGWRTYHFHNTGSNAPMKGYCNTIDNECLWENAGNIAPVLMRIRDENRLHYDRIVAHIKQAAPYFGDFVFKESAGKLMLCWKERYSDKIYYPAQLSDGSLRFICLATLLLQPTPPEMIIIDEPELGLHPAAVNVLGGMLSLASEKRQIIVCTQSRQLVDNLDLDELIVVDRKDGATTCSRLDENALQHWLEDYSLGELWEKNILGGRPQP